MARVIVKSLKQTRSKGSVTEKRVYGPDGRLHEVMTVDARSPTLGSDLLYVFKKNVAKARRENMKLVGAPDRVPTKK